MFTFIMRKQGRIRRSLRRALKLVDGKTFNLGTTCYGAAPNPPCGLTISAENPVYIQGDYNAPVNDGTWAGFSVASSVAADSVTLLSNSWNDINSFISAYDPGSRPGSQTAYRLAIIAGKGIPFLQTAGSAADYGTDGGVHNFLRYLEAWGSPLYYEGSIVQLLLQQAGHRIVQVLQHCLQPAESCLTASITISRLGHNGYLREPRHCARLIRSDSRRNFCRLSRFG